jgi:hypothetical protein
MIIRQCRLLCSFFSDQSTKHISAPWFHSDHSTILTPVRILQYIEIICNILYIFPWLLLIFIGWWYNAHKIPHSTILVVRLVEPETKHKSFESLSPPLMLIYKRLSTKSINKNIVNLSNSRWLWSSRSVSPCASIQTRLPMPNQMFFAVANKILQGTFSLILLACRY